MNELQPQKHNDSCLDMGLLVSLRDGELSAAEEGQAQAHLALCPDCAADERKMRASSTEVSDLLTLLGPSSGEIPDTALALSALQTRIDAQEQHEKHSALSVAQSQHRPFQAKRLRQRSRWWLVAVAAALIALIMLPNAGALANQFLALFQVQHFQPVSVNPQTFRNGIGEDLQSFGNINVQSDNLSTIQHPTQKQVEQYLNFKLLLPGQLPAGVGHTVQFTLIDRAYGTFTFNAAKARTYLAKTGQGNISIPSQLDGATYSITLAPGVIVNYGMNCQSKNQSVSNSSSNIAALGCSGGNPFYIGEIPSPVIQATGKASLKQLQAFVLSPPKLSSGVRLLLQEVNLDSGVVPLPIPPQVNAQQVTVHGTSGVLMADSSMSLGAVIWQTRGIIYVAAGATSNSAEILGSANSLH
ncbi:MAG TPA: zf-HC2 domain-containing protein [Ktedonobacteraceae bacterium]|nr:zf-HC2 domain-containing protein [Ktedonobacteraceae bacterium]